MLSFGISHGDDGTLTESDIRLLLVKYGAGSSDKFKRGLIARARVGQQVHHSGTVYTKVHVVRRGDDERKAGKNSAQRLLCV